MTFCHAAMYEIIVTPGEAYGPEREPNCGSYPLNLIRVMPAEGRRNGFPSCCSGLPN
ncbi:MAG: hypothetical protein KatS3mg130_0408 [Candidatus Sumerlaea sp.]|nr:MAG: hypothetical protein KatS3mg130_0408 [Candidatus Sumerlaea sp.]